MTLSKTCTRCLQEKALEEFHLSPANRFGRAPICKPCACKKSRECRAKNVEYWREHDRQRASTPERKALAREGLRRRRKLYPERNKARDAVARAIKRGLLVRQPCEVCGAEKADAHHDDYSKPLDVRWLCSRHHVEHHTREKEAERLAKEALERANLTLPEST